MIKVPTPTEMSKGQIDNTHNATKKFDYTLVADRLQKVSWSNYSRPTSVVNLVYGPNLSIKTIVKVPMSMLYPKDATGGGFKKGQTFSFSHSRLEYYSKVLSYID